MWAGVEVRINLVRFILPCLSWRAPAEHQRTSYNQGLKLSPLWSCAEMMDQDWCWCVHQGWEPLVDQNVQLGNQPSDHSRTGACTLQPRKVCRQNRKRSQDSVVIPMLDSKPWSHQGRRDASPSCSPNQTHLPESDIQHC